MVSTWSHERLNWLHQVAGHAALIHMLAHSASYTRYFCHINHNCQRLLELNDVFGTVAGCSFVVIVFAAVVIRRWWYEAFYYVHVSFWVVAIVCVFLHQPSAEKGFWKVVVFTAGLWVLDRLIRLARLLVTSSNNNNNATVYPLPRGGTRIVFGKGPALAAPGQHAFVWMPGIRKLETHPFTIVALNPAEFVVASYDGFTKDLHDYAVEHPGAVLKASLDGPYGAVPDMRLYDCVVLVAGGSGASFTFATVLGLLRNKRVEIEQRVVFVWVVSDGCRFVPLLKAENAADPQASLSHLVRTASRDLEGLPKRHGTALRHA